MPRYRVTTIIRETHFVDAPSEEEAISIALQSSLPDAVVVSDRYAEEQAAESTD